MKIDLDQLLDNLSRLNEDDYNEILNRRDSDPFDHNWKEAFNLLKVEVLEEHPDYENIFIKISTLTNQHEITDYIADDLDLIYTAEIKGFKSKFIDELRDLYEKGSIPCSSKI